jgi:hypothetical protein
VLRRFRPRSAVSGLPPQHFRGVQAPGLTDPAPRTFLMRAGLVELLSGEASTEIAGQARTGREVVERARRLEPEVLLTDARMPDVDSSA